ncbi:EAL domain-containing protein [uncultured Phenylobacterium sp.]|uniref:putative bifunctional diguanylate cyclase/phosphodiesterase n=1 Tax=uncultured Phenylobacterium sp. TaxID=349273 RepID=UPI0025DA1E8C|nr:EAL domain-containing protein [uncultured Phenylobacterium sp.]
MRSGFGRGAAALVAAIALGLMGALAGARVYTTVISDRQVAAREEALVANGLRGWILEVEGRVVGQTTWDDAVLNLGLRFNKAWAHENIGVFLHEVAGFQQAYVLDGANRPLYAMQGGRDRSAESHATVAAVSAPLEAKVREAERQRSALLRRPTSSPGAAIQASAIGLVAGLPSIVTATLVQSDFNRVQLPTRAPIVVTVAPLDSGFRAKFSERFLLADLHVHTGDQRVEPGEAHAVMRNANGAVVARMDWRPQRPAWELLKRTRSGLLLAMTVFSVIVAGLFLRGRNAARALIASETQAKHMAYHDHLTGLPNRALFSDRLAHALSDLRRGGGPLGVLALDLDRFKLVNDSYGHAAGDELIIEIAKRLRGLARDNDTVARLGGDEFAILCASATPRGLASFAERIVSALAEPIDLPFGRLFPSVSIGITILTGAQVDDIEALRQADLAVYRAKDAGRGRFQFYEPEMDLALQSRRALEDDLREALSTDALTMVYQPQLDGNRQVVGVEALVRWSHPVRGMVSPAFFVGVAEECGLIDKLGEFTLRRAFTDSLRWPRLTVAVNISAVQLRRGGFPDLVAAILKETGADARRIELEITEGVLLGDDAITHQTLSRLRAMGFTLALDDFGTGYSSLAYLRRYPIDKIKIDRSFITSLGVEKESEAVVGAIVKLARALNLEVIAEGVENESQRSGLRRAGCSNIQGYLYSPPIAADDIAGYSSAQAGTATAASGAERPFASPKADVAPGKHRR